MDFSKRIQLVKLFPLLLFGLLLTGCHHWHVSAGKAQAPEPTMAQATDQEDYVAYQVTYVQPLVGQGINLTSLCKNEYNVVNSNFTTSAKSDFSCLRQYGEDKAEIPCFGFTFNKADSGTSCDGPTPVNVTLVTPYILYQNNLSCHMQTVFASTTNVSESMVLSSSLTSIVGNVGSNAATVSLLSQVIGNSGMATNLIQRMGNFEYKNDTGNAPLQFIAPEGKVIDTITIPLALIDGDKTETATPCGSLIFTPIIKKSILTDSGTLNPDYSRARIPNLESISGERKLKTYLNDKRGDFSRNAGAVAFNRSLAEIKDTLQHDFYLSRSDLAYCLYTVARVHERFAERDFAYGTVLAPYADILRNGNLDYPDKLHPGDYTESWEDIEQSAKRLFSFLSPRHAWTVNSMAIECFSDSVNYISNEAGATPQNISGIEAATRLQAFQGNSRWYVRDTTLFSNMTALFATGDEQLYLFKLGVTKAKRISDITIIPATQELVEQFVELTPNRNRTEAITTWIEDKNAAALLPTPQ